MSRALRRGSGIGTAVLTALLLFALWAGAFPFYLEHARTVLGLSGLLTSFEVATYGNTLLAAATGVYLVNLWISQENVGRWAAVLAGLGALLVLVALKTREVERNAYLLTSQNTSASLYEAVALLSALAVLAYLLMEGFYRSRSAGSFVMPLVMAAVACEIWLVSGTGSDLPTGTAPYWARAHLLAQAMGYIAFALAALGGLASLLPTDASVRERFRLLAVGAVDSLVKASLAVGLAAFSVAVALEMASSFQVSGSLLPQGRLFFWSALVLIGYGLCLYLARVHRGGPRLAWLAVAGFGFYLASFLGSNLLALAA